MRKRVIPHGTAESPADDLDWLDLEPRVQVELTSEDPEYPVEGALVRQTGAGWRALQPGKQTVRLLFDEPHTGLDPRGIRTIKESILTWADRGAAVIVSSHLLELVEDLCSHLLILHRGKSLFFGSMEEARSAFADVEGGVSLEEAFFRATEGEQAVASDATGRP